MLKTKSLRGKSKSRSPPKQRPVLDPFLLIRKGDTSEIQQHLQAGNISLHVTRWSGFTLLHRAAEIGHTELCLLLINAGIPVNVRTARGWHTPLHIALGNGFLETAQALVDSGAEIWKKNKYGEDAFEFGAKRGFVKICEEFKAKFIGLELKENVHRMLSSPSDGKRSKSMLIEAPQEEQTDVS